MRDLQEKAEEVSVPETERYRVSDSRNSYPTANKTNDTNQIVFVSFVLSVVSANSFERVMPARLVNKEGASFRVMDFLDSVHCDSFLTFRNILYGREPRLTRK